MARPLRIQIPGAAYHFTSRGNEKKDIYRDDADRRRFLELLAECVRRYGWIVTAYVLMSNHFHLLIELTRPTLSRGMQWLDGEYAKYFNKRHGRVGYLLQSRPDTPVIEKETYMLNVLRYIVLNPIRAGMVAKPEEYEWSSYRATAGLAPAPEWLSVNEVLGLFSPDRVVSQRMYRDFVYAGIGLQSSPWDDMVGQIYLGSPGWLEQVRDRVEAQPRDYEHPRAQRFLCTPAMDAIIEVVARIIGIAEMQVRNGRGGVPRMLAAWLGSYEGQLPLAGIAAGLGLANRGHVSTLIRSCEERLRSDPAFRSMRNRCVATLRGEEITSEP